MQSIARLFEPQGVTDCHGPSALAMTKEGDGTAKPSPGGGWGRFLYLHIIGNDGKILSKLCAVGEIRVKIIAPGTGARRKIL